MVDHDDEHKGFQNESATSSRTDKWNLTSNVSVRNQLFIKVDSTTVFLQTGKKYLIYMQAHHVIIGISFFSAASQETVLFFER